MQEIEVKIRVASVGALKKKLVLAGARFKESGTQSDYILDYPDHALKKKDELMRVRELKTQRGRRTIVTFKGPKQEGKKIKVREELQFETTEKAGDLVKFFERLGLKVFLHYEKRTSFYALKGTKISIDEFPKLKGMGAFFEIEADTEKRVFAVMKLLGVDKRDVEPRNYVEMVSKLLK